MSKLEILDEDERMEIEAIRKGPLGMHMIRVTTLEKLIEIMEYGQLVDKLPCGCAKTKDGTTTWLCHEHSTAASSRLTSRKPRPLARR